MIQILQIYDMGRPSTQYKVATITTPIVASAETRNTAHNKAGLFAISAGKDLDGFKAAASEGRYRLAQQTSPPQHAP